MTLRHVREVAQCVTLILLLRLARRSFFLGHRILRPFFLVNVFVLDDMSRTLLDDSIPLWLRLAVLRDGPGTLPFSSLPSYLSVLRSIWEGWLRKHPLTPELCAALLVHARRALGTLPCISPDAVHSTLDLFDEQHFADDEENMLLSPTCASPAQEVVEEVVSQNQETALIFLGHDCIAFTAPNGIQRCFVHDFLKDMSVKLLVLEDPDAFSLRTPQQLAIVHFTWQLSISPGRRILGRLHRHLQMSLAEIWVFPAIAVAVYESS